MLAAGRAERFGSNKLLFVLPNGDTLLQRAISAAGTYPVVVVASGETGDAARALGVRTIANQHPERGMSHSLRLASAAIDPGDDLAVLPADLLLIEAEHVAAIAAERRDADVTYPVRADGTPGHPVIFAARTRAAIARLGDNEPIARVRDDGAFTRRVISVEEPWAYRDVDYASDVP